MAKFGKAGKARGAEDELARLAVEYLELGEAEKAAAKAKKGLAGEITELMSQLGLEKFRAQDSATITMVKTVRTTYTRNSVGDALMSASVPVKYHVAVLDQAGVASESCYPLVKAVKQDDGSTD